MRFCLLCSPLAGMITLAGCADGGSVVLSPRRMAAYDVGSLSYVADRGLLAEIVGNPFKTDKQGLDAVVSEVLSSHHFGPVFPVVTEPSPDFRSPYRVVMVFNPAPAAGRATLCERVPESLPPGDVVRVAAAFCASDKLLTSLKGSISGASGPDDPRFRRLIGLVSLELFPPFDDRRGDEAFLG